MSRAPETLAYAALLADRWRAQGRRIHVHYGLSTPPAADAALLHVDLTRTPEPYARLLKYFPVQLNERPLDISKRAISRWLVTRDDDYDGPVIVKTDLNHRGYPERDIARPRGMPARLWHAVRRDTTTRLGAYRHYERKELVPPWVWATPALVVERFFEQRIDGYWAINQWLVLGDHGCVSTMLGPGPVVKQGSRVANLPLSKDVPQEVQHVRRRLGLDYAKIDYIIEDGIGRVIDANRTPNQGRVYDTPRVRDIVTTMVSGLDDFA
jgi:hypothetical protein